MPVSSASQFSTFFCLGPLESISRRPSHRSLGRIIFAHTKAQARIAVVMEAHITDLGVSKQLNSWLATICDVITETHVYLLKTSHFFLEDHQDSGTWNYYFAGHNLRVIFWLYTLDTIIIVFPHLYLKSDDLGPISGREACKELTNNPVLVVREKLFVLN